MGPSPRVRGSPAHAAAAQTLRGSIPACAGKPCGRRSKQWSAGVHPRVCGEASVEPWRGGAAAGPSPRVRGSRTTGISPVFRSGSIPACAGKPSSTSCWCCCRRVHPRVCGEAARCPRVGENRPGPSPRVRGSRCRARGSRLSSGSIPACAGKPRPARSSGSRRRVHPRVCGEAPAPGEGGRLEAGPSPRVRGSPPVKMLPRMSPRSIPACAGKPRVPPRPAMAFQVHPRVCGEAEQITYTDGSKEGPSPRVRGSRSGPSRVGG